MSDEGVLGLGATLTGSVTGTIGFITGINVPGIEADSLETTKLDNADGWKTFMAGLKNAGSIDIDIIYDDENCDVVMGAVGSDNEDWTINLPNLSSFKCEGFIQKLSLAIPRDEKMTQTATIKLSGKMEYTPVES